MKMAKRRRTKRRRRRRRRKVTKLQRKQRRRALLQGKERQSKERVAVDCLDVCSVLVKDIQEKMRLQLAVKEQRKHRRS